MLLYSPASTAARSSAAISEGMAMLSFSTWLMIPMLADLLLPRVSGSAAQQPASFDATPRQREDALQS